ncbi:MAG: hypothetical protein ACI9N1_000719 [Flavobacteriales bacterium]|jgi:hypothetical protein
MIKIFKIILIISMLYFTAVGVLIPFGKIAFGVAFADFLYFAFLYTCMVTSWIFSLIYLKSNPKVVTYELQGIIIVILLILFTFYCFTWGRGAEYPWDGNVLV